MNLWLERYIFPICVAIMAALLISNPFKFDWKQRASLFVAISALTYFIGHSLHKPKTVSVDAAEQRIGFLEHQVESLQAGQKQLADQKAEQVAQKQRRQVIRQQLSVFLKEGQSIQGDIAYNNVNGLHLKKEWEQRVEDYLTKNLEESYAIRFRNPSHQILPYPMGIGPSMMAPWGNLTGKMAMLNDFMSELRD